MERLTFGQAFGQWLDNASSDSKPNNAALTQAMQMAQEAGLVTINGSWVTPVQFADFQHFAVELTDRGPVVIVPEGRFPGLNNYEGGELLRYE